eukprot:scaffold10.g2437.t1
MQNPFDHVTHEVEWFYFRVSNVQGEQLNVRITNAGQASYPSAWKGYNVCASYDRKHWFRIPTTYSAKEGVLSWSCRPRHGAIFFAYFAPYTYEMHQELLAEMQGHDEVRLEMLGETLDGHDLDLLRVGTPAPGKCSIWVWLVRRELEEVGCDLLVDVHGDEELHHCFLGGWGGWVVAVLRVGEVDNRGIPRWDKRLEGLHKAFADAFEAASPDFQQVHGYAADAPGAANLSLCSTHGRESASGYCHPGGGPHAIRPRIRAFPSPFPLFSSW